MVLSWRVALGLWSWAGMSVFARVARERWRGEGRRESLGKQEARERETALKGINLSMETRFSKRGAVGATMG